MRLVILLTLIILSAIPVIDSFAVQFPNYHDGTGNEGFRTTNSWLEYEINLQDQIIQGRTDTTLNTLVADTSLPTLSFQVQDQQTSNLIDAKVTGVYEALNIGNNYCFSDPNWNYDQEIIINGVSYNLPKQSFGQLSFDENTRKITGTGISFQPNLIETLLSNQGVTLNNGDEVIWKVTASNRVTIVEGFLTNNSFLETDLDGSNPIILETGTGLCNVTGQGYDSYHAGLKFELKLIYLNPTQQLIGDTVSFNDFDGDGIADSVDSCSFSAETVNGFEDEDGCPDSVPPPVNTETGLTETVQTNQIVIINEQGQTVIVDNVDTDSDGIVNELDQCPTEAEQYNGISDEDGCPDNAIVDQREFLQRELDRIATTNAQSNVHVDFIDTVNTQIGISGECNPDVENCDNVFTQAVRDAESFTGIKLPFEPTLVNLMLLFGGIAGAVIVIMLIFKPKVFKL